MLTYIVVLLDDTSVSFCHYDINRTERKLIGIDFLREAVLFAMKENLNVQFVYPDYVLPQEYRDVIETIDHTKIGPVSCGEDLDMTIVNSLAFEPSRDKAYLWRCSLGNLAVEMNAIARILPKIARLNVILTDIQQWTEDSFSTYDCILKFLANAIADYFKQGISVQFNLLTDRIMIGKMNNCNAGDTSITLAPNGMFYICPAFYPKSSVGSLADGINIPNKQLYRLDHAPICRKCDAFQCKRCIWLNEMLTLDCNTPSHEQCVASHLERNASRMLLGLLDKYGVRLEEYNEIEEINYLDPFNILNKWNRER